MQSMGDECLERKSLAVVVCVADELIFLGRNGLVGTTIIVGQDFNIRCGVFFGCGAKVNDIFTINSIYSHTHTNIISLRHPLNQIDH